MNAPGPPLDGAGRDAEPPVRPRVVRIPAGPSSGRTNPAAGTTVAAGRQRASNPAVRWPTWPPEPFPGPTEQPAMRPAPVRVLTTKVATPPAQVRDAVAAGSGRSAELPEVADRGAPAAVVAEQPQVPVAAPRRGGEEPRGARWFVVAVVVLSVMAGAAAGWIVTRGDPDHGGDGAPARPTVPATTVASTTSAAPSTTAAPTSTVAAVTNAVGLAAGTPADPESGHVEERFAAHLGGAGVPATPSSAAAVYAVWWQLFGGVPSKVAASADGFAVTDGSGQVLDLSGFTLGADGNVADLVECAVDPAGAPTCNRLSNVVSFDPTLPTVGQGSAVSFQRLAELRLLKARTVRFVTMDATKPVASATSPAADVRVGDGVLAFAVPSEAVPPSVDVTLTYADGDSETVAVTV